MKLEKLVYIRYEKMSYTKNKVESGPLPKFFDWSNRRPLTGLVWSSPSGTNSAQHSYLYLFLAGLHSCEGDDLLGKKIKGTTSINFATFERSLLRMEPLDVLSVTDNFSKTHVIASLPEGWTIAVRRLNRRRLHGDWEFLFEMGIVGKVKRENLVPLLGCCILQDSWEL
ncbi:hypothetical protein AAG906_012096 [Vitis piasezkii]